MFLKIYFICQTVAIKLKTFWTKMHQQYKTVQDYLRKTLFFIKKNHRCSVNVAFGRENEANTEIKCFKSEMQL